MKRMLLEGPAVEPVLVAEAKAHLRLDGDDEDTLIGALIAAGRVSVESDTRRALIAQSWRAYVGDWPEEGSFSRLRRRCRWRRCARSTLRER